MNAPACTVKRYQECEAREGLAYSFDLWIDGKLAAYVQEHGDGGEIRVDWTPSGGHSWVVGDSKPGQRLTAFVATLPEAVATDGYRWKRSVHDYCAELADTFVFHRKLRSKCKRYTVVQYVDQPEGEVILHGRAYSPEYAAQLRAGERKVRTIYNELFAAAAADGRKPRRSCGMCGGSGWITPRQRCAVCFDGKEASR